MKVIKVSILTTLLSIFLFSSGSQHLVCAANLELSSQLPLLWTFTTDSQFYSSPAIGDLDGDNIYEIIIGGWDANVYALSGINGSLLWSYTINDTVTFPYFFSSPALTDLTKDGLDDVIIGCLGTGKLYAIRGYDGSLLWEFATSGAINPSPTVVDFKNNGSTSIICGSSDHTLYVLDGEQGSLLWSFQALGPIINTAAAGDLNNDGTIDVVITSNVDGHAYAYLYVLNGENGTPLWSRKVDNFATAPLLADFNSDGHLDIILSTRTSILILDGADGTTIWSRSMDTYVDTPLSLADVDGDFTYEIIQGSWNKTIYMLKPLDKKTVWSFSVDEEFILSTPCVADIDGDRKLDIIIGGTSSDTTAASHIYVLDGITGKLSYKWVISGGIVSSPSASDIDNDGMNEIVVASLDGIVYAIDCNSTGGASIRTFWQGISGDYTHSRNMELIDEDNDLLSAWTERQILTNETVNDTDGDSLPDGYEFITLFTDPRLKDTDGNGLTDDNEDMDNDGLTNIEEYICKTNPWKWDTDWDTLPDGYDIFPLFPDGWIYYGILGSVFVLVVVKLYKKKR